MSDFKIGDKIKPKNATDHRYYVSLAGKIVDFLGTTEQKFPGIKNEDGDLLTVNPSSYELVEEK